MLRAPSEEGISLPTSLKGHTEDLVSARSCSLNHSRNTGMRHGEAGCEELGFVSGRFDPGALDVGQVT